MSMGAVAPKESDMDIPKITILNKDLPFFANHHLYPFVISMCSIFRM